MIIPGGFDHNKLFNGVLSKRNPPLMGIDSKTLIELKKVPDVAAYAKQVKDQKAAILAAFKSDVIALVDAANAAELGETDRMAKNELTRRSKMPK
ncbi:MAG TPA: hypothetical protein VN455_02200 [Methanotrichaceae archaeon]|nr:hypothetical protein [Methanotrichaceae archaeon]